MFPKKKKSKFIPKQIKIFYGNIFYFKKFIFDINISKQSKNKKNN